MNNLADRFRGFLPVVIDVETGGVNPQQDALLELAAISIKMDETGLIFPDQTYHFHILPFDGAHLDPEALAFNKIDPFHPFRFAVSEEAALKVFFKAIKKECEQKKCQRAVVVGHNAWFDQQFLNFAASRAKLKSNPFHRFTSLDTATLSALVYGQTVLAKALNLAKIAFKTEEAHSALYDAQCTADLFCTIVNHYQALNGWPMANSEDLPG
ncbi:MAG: ribonuclease T [Proteobacteria bacterium]|nr:ribonuclease T [Pseudomonadota bacterium]